MSVMSLLHEQSDDAVAYKAMEAALDSTMLIYREALDSVLFSKEITDKQQNNEIADLKKELVQQQEIAEDLKKKLVQWKETTEQQQNNDIIGVKKEFAQWMETWNDIKLLLKKVNEKLLLLKKGIRIIIVEY